MISSPNLYSNSIIQKGFSEEARLVPVVMYKKCKGLRFQLEAAQVKRVFVRL